MKSVVGFLIAAMRRRLFFAAISVCVLLSLDPHAWAQSENGRAIRFGTVISASGCHNRFVVATKNGVSIIQLIGGTPVLVQDLLSGDMESIGQTVLTNMTRASTVTVFVEESLLSRANFNAKLRFLCH